MKEKHLKFRLKLKTPPLPNKFFIKLIDLCKKKQTAKNDSEILRTALT